MNRRTMVHASNAPQLVICNHAALFPWFMAASINVGVVLMTYLIWRDGLPTDFPKPVSIGMVIFFWLGAIGSAITLFRLPLIRLEVRPEGAKLLRVSLFHRNIVYFTRQDVERLEVRQSTDSEGDPYFACELSIADIGVVEVAEGHSREKVEAVAQQLRQVFSIR